MKEMEFAGFIQAAGMIVLNYHAKYANAKASENTSGKYTGEKNFSESWTTGILDFEVPVYSNALTKSENISTQIKRAL